MTQPALLPLMTDGPHGSRSHMTCHFRCGNACSNPVPNETDYPEFREIAAQAIARRSVLKVAGTGLGALVVGGPATPPTAASATTASRRPGGSGVGTADFSRSRPTSRTA